MFVERERNGRWSIVARWQQPGLCGPTYLREEAVVSAELEQALLAAEMDPHHYGTMLGQWLFTGEIRRAFDRAAGERDRPLEVILELQSERLGHWRWERLREHGDHAGARAALLRAFRILDGKLPLVHQYIRDLREKLARLDQET
ncbi:MAG: hypothetical protein R3300_22600 [Candidatus Promineifilaceae bacterium]|nr:hypothetical protein [Candidatus Promineifilaceae bacterium]